VSLIDSTTGEVVARSFEQNEQVIERGLGTFIEVGEALAEIRDQRQYRDAGYSDFDSYCRERWGMSRVHSTRLIGAAEVVGALVPIGTTPPTSESQARALAPLRHDPPAMAEVMAEVTAEAEATNSKVTASKITEKVAERLSRELHDGELDAIEETLDGPATSAAMAEAIESRDPEPDVQGDPSPITKPDLGGGISHPARYSDNLLPIFADLLFPDWEVLDPFAGTGRIHELVNKTVGIEIEPEWAALHPDTIVGSALAMPFADDTFDAICTSPTYGNRLADHHNASDPDRRRSYTHDLGRTLADDNSGAMHWGDEYREFHERAWTEAVRVLRTGGRFILNIKDHVRDGIQQPVTAWHVAILTGLGLILDPALSQGVPTRHLRQGSNTERAGQELVLVFDKGVDS
jgi:SAM-dependent methyltransferase